MNTSIQRIGTKTASPRNCLRKLSTKHTRSISTLVSVWQGKSFRGNRSGLRADISINTNLDRCLQQDLPLGNGHHPTLDNCRNQNAAPNSVVRDRDLRLAVNPLNGDRCKPGTYHRSQALVQRDGRRCRRGACRRTPVSCIVRLSFPESFFPSSADLHRHSSLH